MHFNVLGPLEVERDGAPIEIGSRRQREILSILLLEAGRAVPTDRILDSAWDPDQPGSENALWVAISRLRATLGDDVVATHDHGYSVEVGAEDIDADRFERLIDEAHDLAETDPDTAASLVQEALDLWRGDAWADVRYRDVALPEARRLDELRISAVEDLAELRLRGGQPGDVVPDLRSLVARAPLRERPVGLLMQALAATERHAEALAVYARHRRQLGDELGLEPSSELRTLEDHILEALVESEQSPAGTHGERSPATITPNGQRRRRSAPWVAAGLAVVAVVSLGMASWALLAASSGPPTVLVVDAPRSSAGTDQLSIGLADAARRLEIDGDELRPDIDVAVHLADALSTEPDVVVVGRDLPTVAPEFDWAAATDGLPDTWFIDLSAIGVGPRPHPRWIHVDFADEEGAFLAGALAARHSVTGVVGWVGGHPGLVDDLRAGFEAGVVHVDPTVRVVSAHTPVAAHPLENFRAGRSTEARATTERVLDAGADIILDAHGEAGIGVMEAVAASDAGSDGIRRRVIETDRSASSDLLAGAPRAARVVLASVSRRLDAAIVLAIQRALDGEPGDLRMTPANGGFSVLDGAEPLDDGDTTLLASIVARFEAGSIDVPPWPRTPPTESVPGASSATATIGEDGPILSVPDTVTLDQPLTLSGSNPDGSGWATTVITVGRLRPGLDADDLPTAPTGLAPFLHEVWDSGIARSWTTVPMGGSGAVTVVPDLPGTWVAACQPFDGSGAGPVIWKTFAVAGDGGP